MSARGSAGATSREHRTSTAHTCSSLRASPMASAWCSFVPLMPLVPCRRPGYRAIRRAQKPSAEQLDEVPRHRHLSCHHTARSMPRRAVASTTKPAPHAIDHGTMAPHCCAEQAHGGGASGPGADLQLGAPALLCRAPPPPPWSAPRQLLRPCSDHPLASTMCGASTLGTSSNKVALGHAASSGAARLQLLVPRSPRTSSCPAAGHGRLAAAPRVVLHRRR